MQDIQRKSSDIITRPLASSDASGINHDWCTNFQHKKKQKRANSKLMRSNLKIETCFAVTLRQYFFNYYTHIAMSVLLSN